MQKETYEYHEKQRKKNKQTKKNEIKFVNDKFHMFCNNYWLEYSILPIFTKIFHDNYDENEAVDKRERRKRLMA